MRPLIKKSLPLLLLAILASHGTASGKCPFQEFRVLGSVVMPAGVEADTVRIYLFLDDMRFTSAYPPTESENEYVSLSETGMFEISVHYSTYSGRWLWRDHCNHNPEIGTLFIVGDDLRALRIRFDIEGEKSFRLESPIPLERL